MYWHLRYCNSLSVGFPWRWDFCYLYTLFGIPLANLTIRWINYIVWFTSAQLLTISISVTNGHTSYITCIISQQNFPESWQIHLLDIFCNGCNRNAILFWNITCHATIRWSRDRCLLLCFNSSLANTVVNMVYLIVNIHI